MKKLMNLFLIAGILASPITFASNSEGQSDTTCVKIEESGRFQESPDQNLDNESSESVSEGSAVSQ